MTHRVGAPILPLLERENRRDDMRRNARVVQDQGLTNMVFTVVGRLRSLVETATA